MSKRDICLLANRYAGKGRALQILKQAEKILKGLPVNFRSVITENTADAQIHTKEAAKQGEYVAVIGGDGSASNIASTLKDNNGVLSLIPAGRGNDFARMLRYPLNTAAACEVLAYGKEITIDLGMANQKLFLNICSLGFDSVANSIANKTRFLRGPAVYLYAGLRALLNMKPLNFKVTIDGREHSHRGYTVAVANAQCYGGGLFLSPHSSIQDGLLEVVLMGEIKKHRMIRNIPKLFRGTHIHEPGFSIVSGRKIRVETDAPYIAHADGEEIQSAPLDVEVLPNSLRVLVPLAHR